MIRATQLADRAAWERLARGYKAFYETELADEVYASSWQRLTNGGPAHCLLADVDGEVLGLAHYLFQDSTWGDSACYLQDLFVDPTRRGQGLGRRLIEAVAAQARARGAMRLFWLTHAENAPARHLYDRLAEHRGFIRYDYAWPP